MVIKNLENKVKLVTIICSLFLVGCVLISISSIWTAKNMVVDAQNKIYVLDGNVPILVQRTTMDETLDVEAKSHIEMFHHYFFTLAPDDKYIKYTMEKAMYLVDETGLAQYNTLKEKGFYLITAKPKAHAFKNEICFPLTKTKCELKKHPNSKFECFFNDFNRTKTSLFLPFPSKLIQDNLVCVLELQE